jgi:SET domain-containing protein
MLCDTNAGCLNGMIFNLKNRAKYLLHLRNTKKILQVKKSMIRGAGNGLFTNSFIAKGEIIVEYKGAIKTWKEITDASNRYLFYVNKNHVIDARKNKKDLARYANDARGVYQNNSIKNNSCYVLENNKVFIKAIRDIFPKSEILVGYGKEYWDTIKKNKMKPRRRT